MKLSAVKVNSNNIEQGIWVRNLAALTGIDIFGDVAVKIRGIGNSDYRKMRSDLFGALPVESRSDADEVLKIEAKLNSQTLLLDWSGITDDAGETVAFSPDYAETLLLDPDFRVFKTAIELAASSVAKLGDASIKADAKN